MFTLRYKSAPSVIALIAIVGCATVPADPPPRSSGSPAETAPPDIIPRILIEDGQDVHSLQSRVRAPIGYQRLHAETGSYGDWLRRLPLRPGRPEVHLYDGRKKTNQNAHHVVFDIDVGSEDLQQCADAVIRLRAEFIFTGPCREEIRFNFTSGDAARWSEWRDGIRPTVSGNRVAWSRMAEPDDGYSNFREYLDTVFMYAGSASLERELATVRDVARPEIGDVFIKGGFPGHAVLVVDVAENDAGERAFLLAQSYMPAQEIHVLRSFDSINPWYHARSGGTLETPEWDFEFGQLRRFNPTSCEMREGQRSS